MKRNIWIPKMSKSRLERLLSKSILSDNDKEELLDFRYFMAYFEEDAAEKGLLVELLVNQNGRAFAPKNIHWVSNIDYLTRGFKSKYFINK